MKFKFTILLLFTTFNLFSQTVLTIPQIQGSGTASAYSTSIKTTGIVTAKFIGSGKIGGYFIQDAVGDGNLMTSDGIFVSTSTDNVSVGNKIEITATVSEYSGRTQLGSITKTSILSSKNPLPIVKVKYNADAWNWEQYEGMLLHFDQILYVTNNYSLKQYGQVTLNPTRKFIPSNQCFPNTTDYSTYVTANSKAQITLDDGITTTNYTPIQFADASGFRRTGERINNLQAVIDFNNSYFVLYPAIPPVFYGNPRPTAPSDLGNYNLKVCGANLEIFLTSNYDPTYGGPVDDAEAAKQLSKITAAMLAIDADIYGFAEIQQGQDAFTKLINAMNSATVAGRYSFINDGGVISGTYTKVGYLYRTDKVTPYLSLKNNNSPSPINRKKAQAFTLKSNNEKFIFSINHFKAKSGCSSATGSDVDQGDGQSCYNATRVAESTSTINFLNTCKTYYGDNDVLIMGDLNAYGKEDPIQTLINGGYSDLHRAFHADSAYSYMYNGEAGYLDHAIASTSLRNQITGVSVFHINADEPDMFGYAGASYQSNMYRYSDHDPVVVGLALGIFSGIEKGLNVESIRISENLAGNNCEVYNALGKKLQLFSINGLLLKQWMADSNEYSIDFSDFRQASGIFLLRIAGTGVISKVIVK
jgi:hypothetical protein